MARGERAELESQLRALRSKLPASLLLPPEADDADDGCRQLAAACHAIFGSAVRAEFRFAEDGAFYGED